MPQLSKDEFEVWKANPVTELVRRYLEDFENVIRQQWARGNEWTNESKAVVQTLEDQRTLELSDIEKFYKEPEEETDDEQDDDD